MIKMCSLVVLCAALSVVNVCAQQCSTKSEPAVKAGGKATTDIVPGAAQPTEVTKKKAVDEKSLLEVKRQLRMMREEMAELEEKIDRMTSVRESDKGRYRE